MKRSLLAAAAALASTIAFAQAPGPVPPLPVPVERPPAPAPGSVEVNVTGTPGKATASRFATDTATIVGLDVAGRTVTLRRRSGREQTVKVGPDVKRLSSFRVGDVIRVDFQQELELEYQPPGSPTVPMSAGATIGANDKDQVPGAVESSGVQGTVTVTAIDAEKRLVSFQEPGGAVYQVKAGPTVQLGKLKAGDRLLATYVEIVAVQLVPVAKR